MNVWSVAMAEHHGQDMLSGIIPAAFSTGSFLGGLVYRGHTWTSAITIRLRTSAAALLAGWSSLLALWGPYAATTAAVVPGAFSPSRSHACTSPPTHSPPQAPPARHTPG